MTSQRVFFGAEDAQSYVREDGRRVLGLGIVRQARSNTLDIIRRRDSRAVERLNERFDEVELTTIADDATFIRGSVREVVITLSIAVAIRGGHDLALHRFAARHADPDRGHPPWP